ncbi:hypothetical protein BDQ12DRAFT_735625 [Crucibulum laeve]|uniref:Uncharacterized protein n=1 Tax=Crucibulum laeve TaxID=68775 RepID=A0A5C3M070_9AGAR|nr:hypothetical protein BDQ12DRAFT_735625 [Crucibulum laeve]
MSLLSSSAPANIITPVDEDLRHELDLKNEPTHIGQHCFAIGEYSDVWKAKILGGEIVTLKVLRGASTSNTQFLTHLDGVGRW